MYNKIKILCKIYVMSECYVYVLKLWNQGNIDNITILKHEKLKNIFNVKSKENPKQVGMKNSIRRDGGYKN